MSEPLSPEREAEIRESLPQQDGYGPPWTLHPDITDGYWLIGYDTDNSQAGLVAKVPAYGFHLACFIADAVTVVPELLAELDRVRTELKKYVGVEPTVAEEMRYVSSLLTAVELVVDRATDKGAVSIDIDLLRDALGGDGS